MHHSCSKLSFLYLRLLFGTTPEPAEYNTIVEAAIDLGKDLLADTSWDTTNLHSPHRHLLPRKDYLLTSDPLLKADFLTVNIEAKDSSIDGFIDDILTITIDDQWCVERAKNAALLIIHTIFRPRQSDETLKRDDPLSLRKLAVEVQIDKHKTFLGWYIQTCSLRLFLPQ